MNDAERHSLELRAARARSRLERRLQLLEERGRGMVHTARRAVTLAALVAAGLSGLGALALLRALTRRRVTTPREYQPLAFSGRVPWLLLALGFAVTGARRALAGGSARRLPLLLPSSTDVQQTRLS